MEFPGEGSRQLDGYLIDVGDTCSQRGIQS